MFAQRKVLVYYLDGKINREIAKFNKMEELPVSGAVQLIKPVKVESEDGETRQGFGFLSIYIIDVK